MTHFLVKGTMAAAMLAWTAAAIAEPVAEGGRKLQTSLSGAAEVPQAGDPDGSGMATVTVNHGQARVCYTISVSNIASATAAHIHEGAEGVAGPVVVGLSAPSDGDSEGCVDIDKELAKNILKSPQNYYVNVHNSEYPGGAVRGQLAK